MKELYRHEISIWLRMLGIWRQNRDSWKGGCTGCSYDMIEGETIKACLGRMERERKF